MHDPLLAPLVGPVARESRSRPRACHIVCAECGRSADVTLEVLAPPGLRLRCLDCLGDTVSVLDRGARVDAGAHGA